MWKFTHGQFTHMPVPVGMGDVEVDSICRDQGGRLWAVFGNKALFVLDGSVWTEADGRNGLPSGAPKSLQMDRLGRMWVSFRSDRLFLIHDSRVFAVSSSSGLRLDFVSAIAERFGRTWIAGLLGLQLLKGDKFISLITHGDQPNEVSGVALGENGDLWANQSSGIMHIKAEELAKFYADSSYKVETDRFDSLDGMTGGAYPYRSLPSLIDTPDGRLWFTSATGIASIDPKAIRRNDIVPSVFISAVEADGHKFIDSSSVVLPAGSQNVSIRYTALSLAIPERVRFRYMLEGFDKQWQDVDLRREAFYPHLPPGHYTFRVRASNDDGVWNQQGAVLGLSVAPAFWQTLPFQFLCGALMVAIAFVFHMIRMKHLSRSIKERLHERIEERERIARDLHDNFFQSIQGLLLRFNAATSLLDQKEPVKSMLEDTLRQSDATMREGRERVLDGRMRAFDAKDLPSAFRSVCTELQGSTGLRYTVAINGAPRPLHPVVSDEIYHLGREALTNSFRHSKAANIEVELNYEHAQVRFCFRDDGVGIEPMIVANGRKTGHWGLPGMRERANHIGSSLTVWSRDGVGTEVELRVPASIVYISDEKLNLRGKFRLDRYRK